MKKVLVCFLIMLFIAFICIGVATIEKNDKNDGEGETITIIDTLSENTSIKQQGTMKIFSLEDFSNITVGESKSSVLYSIDPHCAAYETAYGAVYEFPLDDGRYLRAICFGGIIQSLEFHDTPFWP